MNTPEFQAGVLQDATTEETAELWGKLASLQAPNPGTSDNARDVRLALVDRVDIAPGELRVSISAERVASALDLDQSRIVDDLLEIASPFRHRKRGVETKLVIGNDTTELDETLLRNIGRAHRYFDMVCSGKTFGEIADSEGVSKRRIQQVIELAFLAPDMIRNVRRGKQPVGLTSDWLMRHAFSPIWSEQREQFTAL